MSTKFPTHDEEKSRTSKLSSTFRRRSATARPANYWQKLYQIFAIKRNQRAITAAVVCMVGQQLCGINALQFFSSTFFCDARKGTMKDEDLLANSSYLQPLFLSWGIGLANFLFVSASPR